MVDKNVLPILHVDGSLKQIKTSNEIIQFAGIGGYLYENGKVKEKFSKSLCEMPYINYHEEYAIIEGLKWVKEKKINKLQVKTDSISAIQLFTNQKRSLSKIDKFFLMQYLMLDINFEHIDLIYQNRESDDLAHDLSRKYIKEERSQKIKTNKIEENLIDLTKKYLLKSINEISMIVK